LRKVIREKTSGKIKVLDPQQLPHENEVGREGKGIRMRRIIYTLHCMGTKTQIPLLSCG
jgi:hypothetical protein